MLLELELTSAQAAILYFRSANSKVRTMCCVHVVPLLGYEQINVSDGRRGKLRHAAMVDGDVMESKGMGGKLVMVDGYKKLITASIIYSIYPQHRWLQYRWLDAASWRQKWVPQVYAETYQYNASFLSNERRKATLAKLPLWKWTSRQLISSTSTQKSTNRLLRLRLSCSLLIGIGAAKAETECVKVEPDQFCIYPLV